MSWGEQYPDDAAGVRAELARQSKSNAWLHRLVAGAVLVVLAGSIVWGLATCTDAFCRTDLAQEEVTVTRLMADTEEFVREHALARVNVGEERSEDVSEPGGQRCVHLRRSISTPVTVEAQDR